MLEDAFESVQNKKCCPGDAERTAGSDATVRLLLCKPAELGMRGETGGPSVGRHEQGPPRDRKGVRPEPASASAPRRSSAAATAAAVAARVSWR